MKSLFAISLFTLSAFNLYAQQKNFIELIFKYKDRLELTERVDGKKMNSKFYLLSKSAAWLQYRLMPIQDSLTENNLEKFYIFSDTSISNLFTDKEKVSLFNQAILSNVRHLGKEFKNVKVIDSFSQVNSGFIYQLSDPIYTFDSAYALIDAGMYFPPRINETFKDSYIGQMLIIFKRVRNEYWEIIYRRATITMR